MKFIADAAFEIVVASVEKVSSLSRSRNSNDSHDLCRKIETLGIRALPRLDNYQS